jgi:UDP-glucuronate 4-epimerase
METSLVTGAAGQIGSRLAARLLEMGHTVVAVDNLDSYYSRDLKLHRLNSLNVILPPRFIAHEKDVRDPGIFEVIAPSEVSVVTPKITNVFHLAARPGVRASAIDPLETWSINVLGTVNVANACLKGGVKRLVFASSSSVYGDREGPMSEWMADGTARSQYAMSKYAAELFLRLFRRSHPEMNVAILRYFTVYGPAPRPDMAPFKFMRAIMEDKPITVFGSGEQMRDFTYVDDIVGGTIAASRCPGPTIINLGSCFPVSVLKFVAILEEVCAKRATLEFAPRDEADARSTCADISQARAQLGWFPRVDLPTGLHNLHDWYLRNRDLALTL